MVTSTDFKIPIIPLKVLAVTLSATGPPTKDMVRATGKRASSSNTIILKAEIEITEIIRTRNPRREKGSFLFNLGTVLEKV